MAKEKPFIIPKEICKEALQDMVKDNYKSAYIYKVKADYYRQCYVTKKVGQDKIGQKEIEEFKQWETQMLNGYKNAKAFIGYVAPKLEKFKK